MAMSDLDTTEAPTGEQPLDASPTAEITGGEQPSSQNSAENIDLSSPEAISDAFAKLDQNELANLLEASENVEVTEPPTQTEPEPTRGEDSEKAEATKEEGSKPELKQDVVPDRIRLKGLAPKEKHRISAAVNALRDGDYETFEDAYADLFGAEKKSEAPEGDAKPEEQAPPEVPAAIAAIDLEITDLQAMRRAAREEFNYDKADDLSDQIHAKQLEKETVKRQVEQDAKSDDAFTSTFNQSVTELYAANPDLKDPESPLYERLSELRDIEEYRASQGAAESIALMKDPRFLNTLVTRAKKDLGMSKSESVPPAPAPPAEQRQGTVSPATANSAPLSTEAALGLMKQLSHDELMSVADL